MSKSLEPGICASISNNVRFSGLAKNRLLVSPQSLYNLSPVEAFVPQALDWCFFAF